MISPSHHDRSADLSQVPGLSREQQDRLTRILDAYLQSLEDGRPLPAEDLVTLHPDLAQPLQMYFESLDFLQDAGAGFAGVDVAATVSWPPADPASRQLGDFKLLREIGRGGMGVVYEARQISLDRRVALKVLPFASLLDSKQIARFRNEAQAAAQLHHPHIVPVYAVGTDRGVHYYAMQYIDGQPLDRAIDERRSAGERSRGRSARHRAGAADAAAPTTGSTRRSFGTEASSGKPDDFRTAARLGMQAAEALHAAHEYGIVHRDVKPSNLLLDTQGNLWVADFGLARCRSDDSLTRTGDVVGTMRYMSPEQTRGQPALVDHRTDVYSLGATLYELLTLHPAVRGADGPQLLRQIDRDEPFRPRQWNAAIPLDLENIVLKALSKSRDDRYATARDMADDLRRFLEGKPTVARPPTLLDRAGKWLRRHQHLAAGVVAMLALLAVAFAVSTVLIAGQQRKTEQALVQARRNFAQYRGQLAISNNNLGLLYRERGNAARAERHFREAIRWQRQMLDEQPSDLRTLQDLAASLNNLSFLYTRTDPVAALQSCREALAIGRQLVEARPSSVTYQCDLALTHNNLGALHSRQQAFEEAAAAYRQSVAILEPLVAGSPEQMHLTRDLAVSYNNLGMALSRLDLPVEAEACFHKALQIQKALVGHDPADAGDISSLGGIYNNLGITLERQQRYEEAAASFDKAIAHHQAALEQAPDAAALCEFLSKSYFNRGRVLRSLDRPQAAVEMALQRKQLWPGHPQKLVSIAEELARAGLLIRAHQAAGGSANATPWQSCADLAIATLREAVQAGWQVPVEFPTDLPFKELGDYAQFQEFLSTVRADVTLSPAGIERTRRRGTN